MAWRIWSGMAKVPLHLQTLLRRGDSESRSSSERRVTSYGIFLMQMKHLSFMCELSISTSTKFNKIWFWNHSMPLDHGLSNRQNSGIKGKKNQLTYLFVTNADGLKKLPLLIIGKFQKPCPFKNQTHTQLSFDYHYTPTGYTFLTENQSTLNKIFAIANTMPRVMQPQQPHAFHYTLTMCWLPYNQSPSHTFHYTFPALWLLFNKIFSIANQPKNRIEGTTIIQWHFCHSQAMLWAIQLHSDYDSIRFSS